jgi:hypothetical protein
MSHVTIPVQSQPYIVHTPATCITHSSAATLTNVVIVQLFIMTHNDS